MIRTILVDDEEDARKTLGNFLKRYCPHVEIVAEAQGVSEGIQAIENLKPDLVFLDIQMQDGTGFDLLKKLNNRNFQLIFSTAHDDFAAKAFRFSAIDYLLKPIDPDNLMEAVNRVKENQVSDLLEENMEVLLNSIQQRKFQRISLPTLNGLNIVKIQDIVRCEADSNYTTFCMVDGSKRTVTRTLKEYTSLLPSNQFFRIHQSHLINLDWVTQYIKGDGGSVIMADNEELPVSRSRKDLLIEALS